MSVANRNTTLDDVGTGGAGGGGARTSTSGRTTRTVSTTSRGTALPTTTFKGTTLKSFESSKLESLIKGGLSPIKSAALEAPPTPPVSRQPIPDAVQPLPPEEITGDPKSVPGRAKLEQNPERYSRVGEDWQIQSAPQIVPLRLTSGKRPELKPVLRANGIVVKLGDEYICSKRTLADILNSENPHYDIAENGRVLNTAMGKTVPIIEVDISKLGDMAKRRDGVNIYAGVKSVDYLNETELEPGTNLPKGLLRQINYTLVEAITRDADKYEVWDIMATMQGNYTIQALVTSTAQEENKLDKSKLADFLTGLDDRLKRIRNDFNGIKRVFYNGEPPTDAVSTLKYVKIAKTVDEDEERSKNPIVIKTTEMVGMQENRLDKTITDLSNSIKDAKGLAGAGITKDMKTLLKGADQRQSLIAKWQSYKWTTQEAEYLKAAAINEVEKPPAKTTNKTTVQSKTRLEWLGYEIAGKIVGITGIRWTPAMVEKAKIVVPLPEGWGNTATTLGAITYNSGKVNPIISKRGEERLIKLYGAPPGYNPNRISFGSSSSTDYDNRNELWWMEQNAKRQAEIVKLAYDIYKIELETAKKIPAVQPPGVSLGGQPTFTGGATYGVIKAKL